MEENPVESPKDRLAIISDTHVSVDDPASLSLFPRQVNRKGPELYARIEQEVRRSFESCISNLQEAKPSAIIHTGDVTGGWKEQGLANEKMYNVAEGVARGLRRIAPTYFALGNHDMGYSSAASLKEGGLNRDSIDACQEIYGPLYWDIKGEGGIRSIGINSSLMDYNGKDSHMLKKRDDQNGFVRETLDAHKDEPWALYMHDIKSISRLAPLVAPHADNCRIVVAGDLHNSFKGNMMKNWIRFTTFNNTKRSLAAKFVLCPSVAPLWWNGYERLEMTYKDGNASANTVEIPYGEDADKTVPTRSTLWCLRAMMPK